MQDLPSSYWIRCLFDITMTLILAVTSKILFCWKGIFIVHLQQLTTIFIAVRPVELCKLLLSDLQYLYSNFNRYFFVFINMKKKKSNFNKQKIVFLMFSVSVVDVALWLWSCSLWLRIFRLVADVLWVRMDWQVCLSRLVDEAEEWVSTLYSVVSTDLCWEKRGTQEPSISETST